ncbi:hypothetical protein DOO78_22770 [Roseicella frigidaeris]|uniref:Uncharacterized protein n=2 Tax=Roseicella TaxID=2730923 RepID=A0A327M0X2_9PROT|nr:hypothetical protein DOO78_22770 [Roseicella frigidaeris]
MRPLPLSVCPPWPVGGLGKKPSRSHHRTRQGCRASQRWKVAMIHLAYHIGNSLHLYQFLLHPARWRDGPTPRPQARGRTPKPRRQSMRRTKFGMIATLAAVLAAAPALAQQQRQGQEAREHNEQEIQLSEVPQAAMQAAQRALGGVQITEAARVTVDGRQLYELEGKDASGREVEVYVTADGTVVRRETEPRR